MTTHWWLSLTPIDHMITRKEEAAMEVLAITATIMAIAAILDMGVVVALEATAAMVQVANAVAMEAVEVAMDLAMGAV
jgi:hypothetical protein